MRIEDVNLILKYSRKEIEEMIENHSRASKVEEVMSRRFVNYWMDVYRIILNDNLLMRDELTAMKTKVNELQALNTTLEEQVLELKSILP